MTSVKPQRYKVKDVARICAISQWEVRRLCEIGVLERRYIGEGHRYYTVTAGSVQAYLDGQSSEASVS